MMTAWEALVALYGDSWALRLWATVRDRPGLCAELAGLGPRWEYCTASDGTSRVSDVNAAYRAAWLSARADEIEAA